MSSTVLPANEFSKAQALAFYNPDDQPRSILLRQVILKIYIYIIHRKKNYTQNQIKRSRIGEIPF